MEICIEFRGKEDDFAVGETLEVTSLGNNLFRLEDSPLFNEDVHYGDVVELSRQEDDSWLFVRVAQPSRWHHINHILSKSLVESEPFELWLSSIIKRRGFWQVAFGGVVFVSYPPDAPIDFETELQEVVTAIT